MHKLILHHFIKSNIKLIPVFNKLYIKYTLLNKGIIPV